MKARTPAAALAGMALVAFVAIAGCGGGNDNNSSSTGAAQAQSSGAQSSGAASGGAAASNVNVSETEYKLSPSDPTVKKGTVTFKATNDGKVQHSIEVEGPGGEQRLQTPLNPGQSGTLKVDFTKPGKYEWYCPIDGHKNLGMKGEVTVR